MDRKSGNGPIHVSPASVSIAGGIQPQILGRALGQRHFDDGLAPRLLLAMPPRRLKKWTDADVAPDLVLQIELIFEGLLELGFAEDPHGGLKPIVIPLSPTGREAFIRFYNEHAEEQRQLTEPRLADCASFMVP